MITIMEMQRTGRTVCLPHGVSITSWGSIGGKLEGEGPLAGGFDEIEKDSFCGKTTWEQGETVLQQRALAHALRKGGLRVEDLDVVFSGDLLNQCTPSAFALRDEPVSVCGLYDACATFGEGLGLGAILLSAGAARTAAVMTSSHFCAAERQYRSPVPYGSQRSPTAQWTVTGSGCCVLSRQGDGPYITHVTQGRIVDMGITDITNMGAAMAPAAIDTLTALFHDTHTAPTDYDLIVTGDLGAVGHGIVADLMERQGVKLGERYTDCGLLIYDRKAQDMHAGGSGAGCSAAVLCAHLLPLLQKKKWKRMIFAPTGALLSPTSSFQKQSIPGVCHAVVLSTQA